MKAKINLICFGLSAFMAGICINEGLLVLLNSIASLFNVVVFLYLNLH